MEKFFLKKIFLGTAIAWSLTVIPLIVEGSVIKGEYHGTDGEVIQYVDNGDGTVTLTSMYTEVYTDNWDEWRVLQLPSEISGKTVVGMKGFTAYDYDEIVLPDNLEYLVMENDFGFLGEWYVDAITISTENNYFSTEEGVLFDKKKETLYIYPRLNSREEYMVPASVKKFADYSFRGQSYLHTVYLSESLAEMGKNPFAQCYNLRQIVIPDTNSTYKMFGDILVDMETSTLVCCMRNDEYISDYMIPEGIERIGDGAFIESTLEYISCPTSLKCIGSDAFKDSMLCCMIFNDGLATIESSAFQYSKLQSLNLPDSLQTIGENAFRGIWLEDTVFEFPEGLEYLGNKAFADLGVGTFVLPESISEIDGNPFGGYMLTSIKISPENEKYAVIEDVLFEKETKTLISYPPKNERSTYDIPEGIKGVGKSAFYNCDNLFYVKMPETLEEIGNNAFESCNSLESLQIPDSVRRIGDSAFAYSDSLWEITLGNGLNEIGAYAFEDACNGKIIIPESVEYIGENAFTSYYLACTLIVERDSYAAEYAKNNDVTYEYVDASDWLN